MRAIQLVGKESLAWRDVEEPRLSPSDLIVRVRAAGVCETDLHFYRAGEERHRLPLTLGHEFAGEVMRVGEQVTGFHPGDRVAVEPSVVCGKCRFCLVGRYNLCARFEHLGQSCDGAFAEYVAAPARNAHRLPESVTDVAGALVEPFACALHGYQGADLKAGDDVLIVGDGFFGMVFAQLARALDAGRIVVLGHHENRQEICRACGAETAIDERDPAVAKLVGSLGGGFGPQVVVDTIGSARSISQSVALAGRGGRIALFGITSRAVTLDPLPLLVKEASLFGTNASPGAWPDVIRLLAAGRLLPDPLVSSVLPMSRLEEAFALKASRSPDVIKIVVTQ